MFRTSRISLVFVLLPCLVSAQEVGIPDSLKTTVNEVSEELNSSAKPDFDNASFFSKTLNFEDGSFPGVVPDCAYPDNIVNINRPVLPFGLYGSNSYSNYIGLGATNSASLMRDFSYGNMTATAYVSMAKHFYDYRNINTVAVGGSISYAFNDCWSVTAFGKYVPDYSPFRPAIQSMMPMSNYGGYVTYDMGNFAISGGVRRDFNPYTRSWETNPIIMPTVKIGDVKIGVDLGPAIKNGIQSIQNDRRQGPPPPGNRNK